MIFHFDTPSSHRGRLFPGKRASDVRHAGGDAQRRADGGQDADDGLHNEFPSLFLCHSSKKVFNNETSVFFNAKGRSG